MRRRFDLIVIGAGPAGACAAYEAASRGLSTLILERKLLPRDKTCGGGLPLSLGNELPNLVPEAFVEATVTHLRHTWRFRNAHLAPLNPDPSEPPMSLWMVQRRVFDNALTERALKAGSLVCDGLAVESLEPDGETGVRLSAGGDVYHAETVLGADGVNGVTARAAGLRPSRTLAIALEAEVSHTWGEGHESLRPHIAHLDYAVPKGYAWVFPKAGHLSVGAGTFGRRSAEGRGEIRKEELSQWVINYLSSLGIARRPEEIVCHGYPLPIWNGREPVTAWNGRILLAGDAAGLVNPLFGDGISYACRSGALAGKTVAEGNAPQWTEILAARFAGSHDAALTIAKFFYQFPEVCFRMGIRRRTATRTAARLLSGDLGFDTIVQRTHWKRLLARPRPNAW